MKLLVSSPTLLQTGTVCLYASRIEIREEPKRPISVVDSDGCVIMRTNHSAIVTPVDFTFGPIVVEVEDES